MSNEPSMEPRDAKVEWLTVAGDPEAWRAIGLTVGADGLLPLFGTGLRIVPAADGSSAGIVSWALSGLPSAGVDQVDGLATESVEPQPPSFAAHPLGASGLDHVVVLTGDLERTSAAIAEATGHELKRVRDLGAMRQGFHRIGRGGLIVEIVERAEVTGGTSSFWGLVINVDALDHACALLGPDLIGAAKDAVQPGRRIATIRESAGLGLPVALMST